MIWLTSDQHFYHEKINRYENRGYSDTTSMNNDIIKKHNEVVAKEDTIYHLGDFAFAKNWKDVRNILDRLNGKHHLIIGNHDKIYVWDYCEAGFLTVHTHLQLEDYWLVHDPAVAGVLLDKK